MGVPHHLHRVSSLRLLTMRVLCTLSPLFLAVGPAFMVFGQLGLMLSALGRWLFPSGPVTWQPLALMLWGQPVYAPIRDMA